MRRQQNLSRAALAACVLLAPAAALAAASSPDRGPDRRVEGLTPGADKPVDLHNGSFQHGIDIEVPEFHGLKPGLALSYSS